MPKASRDRSLGTLAKQMKLRFATFLVLLASPAFCGAEVPTLEAVFPEVSPLSQRQRAVEEYQEIHQDTWKLYIPKGYRGLLTFRQRDEIAGKFEVGENSTNYILFMVGPSPRKDGKMRITFGFQNHLRSIDVTPRHTWTNWTIGYGDLKGNENCNVFQINDGAPDEGPTTWCELQITKQ
jgi:hypothetical protein